MMRRTIESLPQGGTISIPPPADTGTEFHEMTISDAVTAFSFGENPATAGETIIGMRPQSEEDSVTLIGSESIDATLYQVSISRERLHAETTTDGDGMVFRAGDDNAFLEADEQGRYWLPLLNHVTALSWRFWDETQSDWIEEWTDDSRMPLMLELSLRRSLPARHRSGSSSTCPIISPKRNSRASNPRRPPANPKRAAEAPPALRLKHGRKGNPATVPQPGQRSGDGRPQRGDGKGKGFKGKGFGKGKGPRRKRPRWKRRRAAVDGRGAGRAPGAGGGGTAPPGNPGGGR